MGAKFSVFGLEAGMNIIERSSWYRRKLAEATDPEAFRKKLREEYSQKYIGLYAVESFRHFDNIIEPKDTRSTLIRALDILSNKKVERTWRKHGNSPL